MNLNEKGVIYLEGRYQDGVFQKNRIFPKSLEFRNIGDLNVSSIKVFFYGEKENVEFNINDISNIELKKLTGGRVLAGCRLDKLGVTKIFFNLKNGDVYSFWCYLKEVRGKEGVNLMIKKTESLYHLLDKMINNKTNGDQLIKELDNYHSKQSVFQTEAQNVSQKQVKDRKTKFWCEFGCMVLFPSIIVVIVILMMIL